MDFTPDQIERLFPGSTEAIARLNVSTGAANADEGYAAWIVEVINDVLYVSAIQPHYVRGEQKSFMFDGEEFV